MFGRQALLLSLMTFGVSLAAQGASGVVAEPVKGKSGKTAMSNKPAKLTVKNVRQKDGSVMLRLALPNKTSATKPGHSAATLPHTLAESDPPPPQSKLDQWLDAVTEPRVMSALAAIAVEPSAETKGLMQNVDPTKVRNWTEFVDPELYLRWMAGGPAPRFGQAIHNRTPMAQPGWLAFPIQFPVPQAFQPGAPLKPTVWSHALEEGSGGEAAVQEWLKLPLPDPKSNPWLKTNQHYRY